MCFLSVVDVSRRMVVQHCQHSLKMYDYVSALLACSTVCIGTSIFECVSIAKGEQY